MISNPFFLLSLFMSSFLAFFTVAFGVELVIKTFKIHKHRLRATLRLLPFISLLLDWGLSKYSIGHWINPLSCESCVQKFFLEVFFPQLKDYLSQQHISLIYHLGGEKQHLLFSLMVWGVFGVSLLFVLVRSIQASISARELLDYVKNGSPSQRAIHNNSLADHLKNSDISIYFSQEIQVPLTGLGGYILIPEQLSLRLNQQEYEAVVAHEFAHIKSCDPLIRLFYHLTATFYWWVPTAGWRKKIEQDQELACDHSVVEDTSEGETIASALLKVARAVKELQTVCSFSGPKHTLKTRIQVLLGNAAAHEETLHTLNLYGVIFGICLLGFCILWM